MLKTNAIVMSDATRHRILVFMESSYLSGHKVVVRIESASAGYKRDALDSMTGTLKLYVDREKNHVGRNSCRCSVGGVARRPIVWSGSLEGGLYGAMGHHVVTAGDAGDPPPASWRGVAHAVPHIRRGLVLGQQRDHSAVPVSERRRDDRAARRSACHGQRSRSPAGSDTRDLPEPVRG